ncbi:hypothetical protein ROHU_008298 [Labeo rohita]|uniref:Uncharacterized protein n=1 Tax=Labeo rohita TaxID=84645 RepID=A0A498MBM4_LABRO|nr:hypothetical protein ROHU_008298 [Labeo rohita]
MYFHTAAAVYAPTGAFPVFPPCRNSDSSRRILYSFSPLPQQYLLPQEPPLYFHTAAVVSLQQEPFLYFLSAAAVSAPAGASSLLPHCRSSVYSSTSFPRISTLQQYCPLPQVPSLYFHTAAAVSAPAGAFSVFPHYRSSVAPAGAFSLLPLCRSSVRSCRSLFSTSTLL